MSETEIEEARAELRRELPHALRNLLAHYNLYIATQMPNDIKEFNAFNSAGRNALTHLQMLLKLYKLLGGGLQSLEDLQDEIEAAAASLEDEDA